MPPDRDAITGSMLGLAVGDALGLPCENLSPRRAKKLFPHLDRYQFFFRRGLFSDDTEHACLTGQALLVSGGDAAEFQHDLARRLRWWSAGVPAGTGRATIRACAKLWLGWSPEHSGVFSAGNGPAMRAPILGLCFGSDPARLKHFARISTRLTHTDPKAEVGALAVAWAAHRAAETRTGTLPEPAQFLAELRELLGTEPASGPLLETLEGAVKSLLLERTTEEFALDLGLKRGATGYMYHTVPVSLYAWLRYPDNFRTAVQSAIRCGGDTDTVAAIAGALVGARVGKAGIPAEWLRGAIDWPRSVRWVEKLAGRVAEGAWLSAPQCAEPLAVWVLPARNAAFFAWVLVHAARRLLPPY
ncbi:ADP-ribosylglycohydrolase family protein [Gemmata sp. G18]|uniref:ADP-ribosylglycohydrolase family protein n=1 Tax=Gemmata palustris TaxID=2822762 RepID=A0ABS5BM22_9BACT|nr:ADP-ribosylglycohydrolase family protein [Gemmata palustris]MBP3954522.1 ADP-ribosylglycohydrolase family protein [Gemmata palustris]